MENMIGIIIATAEVAARTLENSVVTRKRMMHSPSVVVPKDPLQRIIALAAISATPLCAMAADMPMEPPTMMSVVHDTPCHASFTLTQPVASTAAAPTTAASPGFTPSMMAMIAPTSAAAENHARHVRRLARSSSSSFSTAQVLGFSSKVKNFFCSLQPKK